MLEKWHIYFVCFAEKSHTEVDMSFEIHQYSLCPKVINYKKQMKAV